MAEQLLPLEYKVKSYLASVSFFYSNQGNILFTLQIQITKSFQRCQISLRDEIS